jgi:hypothetical protein
VQLSGPGTAVLATPDAASTEVTFPEPGSYSFEISASDGEFTVSDQFTVDAVIQNTAPYISGSILPPDGPVILEDSVRLSASGWDDGLPNRTLTTQWSAVAGAATFTTDFSMDGEGEAFLEGVTAHFPSSGTYRLRFTVSDGELSASEEIELEVVFVPVAFATVTVGQTVGFSVRSVDILDGRPFWNPGGGVIVYESPMGRHVDILFNSLGTWTVEAYVPYRHLEIVERTIVTVVPAPPGPNVAPTVDAGQDSVWALNESIVLNGSARDDRQLNPVPACTWTQLSGPGPIQFYDPTSPSTTATAPTAGSYEIELSAWDGEFTSRDSVRLIVLDVLPPGDLPPVVDAGPDWTFATYWGPPFPVRLQGSFSDDGLPANILSARWTIPRGEGGVTINDPSSAETFAQVDAPGIYVFELSVSDGRTTVVDEMSAEIRYTPY